RGLDARGWARRWTCPRTPSVGRGSAFVPPAWPYRSWTRSSEMRSKCRRSEETDPRSRPPADSVRWVPETSSSTGEPEGPPASPRDSPSPRQIFTFTHPPLPSALIPHAGDGEAMALASVHTRSSVPPGAWAMLGRTDLEASTCWDFPTQADGHPRAGDASFNG